MAIRFFPRWIVRGRDALFPGQPLLAVQQNVIKYMVCEKSFGYVGFFPANVCLPSILSYSSNECLIDRFSIRLFLTVFAIRPN